MMWAALNGKETCMQILLDHGIDPRLNEVSDICRENNDDGYLMLPAYSHDEMGALDTSTSTPLVCAVQHGHATVSKLLIDAGANVNARGGADDLPIMWAVSQSHAEVLAILLAAGADAHIQICGWETLLVYAASSGYAEIAKLLLDGVAGHCTKTSYTPSQFEDALVYAIRGGHRSVVRVFVESGTSNINALMAGFQTPLDIAGEDGSEDMANLLLDLGLDIHTPVSNGDSPLHRAVWKGHLVTVMSLLCRGASIEARNAIGFSPLAYSVFCEHPEIMKVLLEHDADIAARDDDGDTPLLLAARFGLVKPLAPLLETGADPSATDKIGYTPLCLAVCSGDVRFVSELLGDEGASPARSKSPGGHFIDTPDPLG